MSKKLAFKDFGFKLAVINHLMYKNNSITPQVRAEQLIEAARNLSEGEGEEVIEEEGYEMIPEVKAYFEQLEITEDMVEGITVLRSDGGDEIYLEIIPFWDGEDDVYDVKSADDVQLLPNLKKAKLLVDSSDEQLKKEFEALGVELGAI